MKKLISLPDYYGTKDFSTIPDTEALLTFTQDYTDLTRDQFFALSDLEFTDCVKTYVLEELNSHEFIPLGWSSLDDEGPWRDYQEDVQFDIYCTPNLIVGVIYSDTDGVDRDDMTFFTSEDEALDYGERLHKNYNQSPYAEAKAWSAQHQGEYYAEAESFAVQRDGDFGDFTIYDSLGNLVIDNLRQLSQADEYITDNEALKKRLASQGLVLEKFQLESNGHFGKNLVGEVRCGDLEIKLDYEIIGGQGQLRSMKDFIDVPLLKKAFEVMQEIERRGGDIDTAETSSDVEIEVTFETRDGVSESIYVSEDDDVAELLEDFPQ